MIERSKRGIFGSDEGGVLAMMCAAYLPGKISTYAAQMAGREMEVPEPVGGPWPLLPLDKVLEEPWDFWRGDVESSGWRSVLGLKFSDADCSLDDKGGDLFEQYNDDGHLCENAGPLETSNFWFCEDTEVFLARGVGSLGSGSKGLELVMSVGSADS
ncbi:MAG: hypothetical protein R6U13_02120 [Desulfatiglandaceae bacterium]